VRVFHADEPSLHATPANVLAGLMLMAFLWTGSDNEFQVKGDVLQICRAEEDTELNEDIDGLLPGAAKAIVKVSLREVEYPVKLCVQPVNTISGWQMGKEPIALPTMCNWICRIGMLAGFEFNTIAYSLRYMAGNSLDQNGSFQHPTHSLHVYY
jgi:hypothetical protein